MMHLLRCIKVQYLYGGYNNCTLLCEDTGILFETLERYFA